MDNGLKALITAATATGAPVSMSSRYNGSAVLQMRGPGGVPVAYLAARLLPQPAVYTSTMTYRVRQGDRLDNLAARFLGDAALFWMIADANGAVDPWSLTVEPGRVLLIPLTAGIPSGARRG